LDGGQTGFPNVNYLNVHWTCIVTPTAFSDMSKMALKHRRVIGPLLKLIGVGDVGVCVFVFAFSFSVV
jgi:hypothetical protein